MLPVVCLRWPALYFSSENTGRRIAAQIEIMVACAGSIERPCRDYMERWLSIEGACIASCRALRYSEGLGIRWGWRKAPGP